MKIRTHFDPKPIPDRSCDWSAYDEETYEPGAPLGFGETEEEAIADLEEQIEEEKAAMADMDNGDWPEDPGDWRDDAARDAGCYLHGDPFTGR